MEQTGGPLTEGEEQARAPFDSGVIEDDRPVLTEPDSEAEGGEPCHCGVASDEGLGVSAPGVDRGPAPSGTDAINEVPTAVTEVAPLADRQETPSVSSAGPATAALPDAVREGLPARVGWPPVAPYALLWAIFAGSTYLTLQDAPRQTALVDVPAYGYMVASGLTLVACAPVVAISVWLAARRLVSAEHRKDVFAVTLARAASVALLGVVAWWCVLLVLESTRAGVP